MPDQFSQTISRKMLKPVTLAQFGGWGLCLENENRWVGEEETTGNTVKPASTTLPGVKPQPRCGAVHCLNFSSIPSSHPVMQLTERARGRAKSFVKASTKQHRMVKPPG